MKKSPSNPVAPTTFSKRNVKLTAFSLSPQVSLNERLGQALGRAGEALLEAAAILQGRASRTTCTRPSRSQASSSGATWITVVDLVNEFLLAKARAGRGDRYLRQLRVCLKNFAGGRARTAIDQVDVVQVEKWMQDQEWSARTQRGYLSDVRTMFNYAVRRGYVDRNPAAGVELPVLDGETKIEIHSAEQVRQVLEAARRADLDVCRHLAVRYFAGVRSAEAHRLRETDIKLDQNLIEVPAVKSKTRARRLVTIQPNLRAWLDLGGELRAVGDMTVRAVIRLSKVTWSHNVTRHSFVSYHLAQFNNAGKTALEAGHTEQMLFKHYRALVTPAAAAEFWAILPKKE
jgi:integrase